ncbi:MAG: AAA family ATPase [Desulfobacterales bacterium]|jgi:general secretion pathway protein A
MDYFSILNFKQEPFSNSPDPEFFFHSREHLECLQKLELSLLLRRGLNVIIGEVGTGKTTLCRQLIRRFARRDEITTHLILDPYFLDANEFLTTVGKMIMGPKMKLGSNEWQIKEQIKQYLFKRGVDQNKTTVLIIDEGQKIPVFCLEILREFLNYETNEFKLLQIIIFAQTEFENTIKKYANFADRINLYHYLKPLSFRDTRLMIKFRLEKSKDTNKKMDLFSYPALLTIYRKTGGYPRKIINLCHHCVLAMIVQNRSIVGYRLVRSCIKRIYPKEPVRWKGAVATAGIAVFAATILLAFQIPDQLKTLLPEKITAKLSALHQTEYRGANQPDVDHEASGQIDTPVAMESVQQAEVPVAVETELTPADLPETVSDEIAAEAKTQVASIEEMPVVAKDSNPVLYNEPQSQEAYARILGDIKLKHNETLSRVIQRVYGLYTSKYFRLLILANPDIDDPDRVEIGQTVHLPAIPATVAPRKEKVWWILMTEGDTLETAYDYLRTYPDHAPPVRLIPYWTSQSGTRFAVILKEYFYDKASADQYLRNMPPDLSPKGTVSTLWDENTVFFANPFSGRKIISKSEVKIRIDNAPSFY